MQVVVQLALVDQLRVLSGDRLHLNGHVQVGLGVDGLVDLAESALVDLAYDLEILAHLLQHLRHSYLLYYKQ